MLVIRPEQMEAFRQATLSAFEVEMVKHCQEFSPEHCQTLGSEGLRLFISRSVERAIHYGWTNRGPIRLFLESRILFGIGFDDDPLYPWAAKVLNDPRDQMQRADRLYQKILDYQHEASGADGCNFQAALRRFADAISQPSPFSSTNFAPDVLAKMKSLFPEKSAYVDESSLHAIIDKGSTKALERGLPRVRGEFLLILLMFLLGHRCGADPLYPWIRRCLERKSDVDPLARVEMLERDTIAWIERAAKTSPEEEAT